MHSSNLSARAVPFTLSSNSTFNNLNNNNSNNSANNNVNTTTLASSNNNITNNNSSNSNNTNNISINNNINATNAGATAGGSNTTIGLSAASKAFVPSGKNINLALMAGTGDAGSVALNTGVVMPVLPAVPENSLEDYGEYSRRLYGLSLNQNANSNTSNTNDNSNSTCSLDMMTELSIFLQNQKQQLLALPEDVAHLFHSPDVFLHDARSLPVMLQNKYTLLCPLEMGYSSIFEHFTKVYKAVVANSPGDDLTGVALRRIDNFSTSNFDLAQQAFDLWRRIPPHVSILPLKSLFVTNAFGAEVQSLVLVHSLWPGSVSLHNAHIQQSLNAPNINNNNSNSNSNSNTPTPASASLLWSYASQLLHATHHAHAHGVSFRNISAKKVLVGFRNRVKVHSCGVLDALRPVSGRNAAVSNSSSANRRKDVRDLGQLLVDVGCGVQSKLSLRVATILENEEVNNSKSGASTNATTASSTRVGHPKDLEWSALMKAITQHNTFTNLNLTIPEVSYFHIPQQQQQQQQQQHQQHQQQQQQHQQQHHQSFESNLNSLPASPSSCPWNEDVVFVLLASAKTLFEKAISVAASTETRTNLLKKAIEAVSLSQELYTFLTRLPLSLVGLVSSLLSAAMPVSHILMRHSLRVTDELMRLALSAEACDVELGKAANNARLFRLLMKVIACGYHRRIVAHSLGPGTSHEKDPVATLHAVATHPANNNNTNSNIISSTTTNALFGSSDKHAVIVNNHGSAFVTDNNVEVAFIAAEAQKNNVCFVSSPSDEAHVARLFCDFLFNQKTSANASMVAAQLYSAVLGNNNNSNTNNNNNSNVANLPPVPSTNLVFVVQCLNKLDAGTNEVIPLPGPDGRSLMLLSYAQIQSCIEFCYNELTSRNDNL